MSWRNSHFRRKKVVYPMPLAIPESEINIIIIHDNPISKLHTHFEMKLGLRTIIPTSGTNGNGVTKKFRTRNHAPGAWWARTLGANHARPAAWASISQIRRSKRFRWDFLRGETLQRFEVVHHLPPGKHTQNFSERSTMLLMGKLTTSAGPFSIAILNYQRV